MLYSTQIWQHLFPLPIHFTFSLRNINSISYEVCFKFWDTYLAIWSQWTIQSDLQNYIYMGSVSTVELYSVYLSCLHFLPNTAGSHWLLLKRGSILTCLPYRLFSNHNTAQHTVGPQWILFEWIKVFYVDRITEQRREGRTMWVIWRQWWVGEKAIRRRRVAEKIEKVV